MPGSLLTFIRLNTQVKHLWNTDNSKNNFIKKQKGRFFLDLEKSSFLNSIPNTNVFRRKGAKFYAGEIGFSGNKLGSWDIEVDLTVLEEVLKLDEKYLPDKQEIVDEVIAKLEESMKHL